MLKYFSQQNFNLKSKLPGEEGRMDAETARSAFKINIEMDNYLKELSSINKDNYYSCLTKQDFVQQVRQSFRSEL